MPKTHIGVGCALGLVGALCRLGAPFRPRVPDLCGTTFGAWAVPRARVAAARAGGACYLAPVRQTRKLGESLASASRGARECSERPAPTPHL